MREIVEYIYIYIYIYREIVEKCVLTSSKLDTREVPVKSTCCARSPSTRGNSSLVN
jgi:hypothetical protein